MLYALITTIVARCQMDRREDSGLGERCLAPLAQHWNARGESNNSQSLMVAPPQRTPPRVTQIEKFNAAAPSPIVSGKQSPAFLKKCCTQRFQRGQCPPIPTTGSAQWQHHKPGAICLKQKLRRRPPTFTGPARPAALPWPQQFRRRPSPCNGVSGRPSNLAPGFPDIRP